MLAPPLSAPRPCLLLPPSGPRLKVGVDAGSCASEISPVTGRMTYRGKVMNRAARIGAK